MADEKPLDEHQTTEVVEQDSPTGDPVDDHYETEVTPSEPNPEQSGGTIWDAPNQQVVGQPHPSEEGTGGTDAGLEKAAGTIEEEEPAPKAKAKAKEGPAREKEAK